MNQFTKEDLDKEITYFKDLVIHLELEFDKCQGVPQLQQTYMYNKPHDISGINTAAYTTTPQSYINSLNLGQQVGFVNSLPQSLYGSQFINQQQAAEAAATQTQIDSSRNFNNYFNNINGFAKGAENTQYQVDQLMQIQAANQPQQQKIVQTQKQIQAPYSLQNQQQQQFQISQQYQQQAQLPQQQQLQAQSQQRQTAQPAASKQKQQTSSSSTLPNISQPNQPFGLAISGSSNKQVQSAANNSSSNKSSKLGVSEITPQNQKQSSSSSSSKSKSKSSNNSSAINLLQQTQIPMNNTYNVYPQNRNGAIPNQVKIIETEAIKSCICAQVPRLRNSQSELIQCKNKGCEHKLHLSCMRISPKDEESITQFECPSCILKKYDPLHHVEQTLIDCQVMMGIPNKQLDFQLTTEMFTKIKDHSEYSVEIRCIRIDGTKNIYETTWPDFGNLRMNNEVILELKPLQNNSSLKKRKDEKHTFKGVKNLKEGINHLQISEFNCNIIEKQQLRITENSLHCISVFIIRRLTVDQLVSNIRRESTRPADECKQQIQDYFHRQNKKSSHEEDDDDLCIDSLSVPLTCSLDMKLIQTPAKGRFCKHFQCFSLENFIITTETVNPRKWKCNICKAKCYDIIIDEYILKIIQEINEKQIKNVTDVKFDGKGQYSFDQQSYSDDDDDYDDDSKPIVKKPSQNQASAPAPAAAQPITVSPTNSNQAVPIQSVQAQLINKAPINGNNNPKGVNIESHSNSNALESQQLQIQDQVSGGNKKKSQPHQILVIDSDEEEPPIQKKAQTVAPAPAQLLQQVPLQIQALQQNGQPHHHHHLNIPQNNFPANVQNGSGISIHQNTNLMNLNQAASLNGVYYKNLQNANSHQTSNTAGLNTVNSQNINQTITLINTSKTNLKKQGKNSDSKKARTKMMKKDQVKKQNLANQLVQNKKQKKQKDATSCNQIVQNVSTIQITKSVNGFTLQKLPLIEPDSSDDENQQKQQKKEIN
uniref:Micronuclear isoform n=1 Tax=Tetrahymena thermophila TaxID=5911 RepID=A0A1P8LFW7_TETTH|nr:micronuclear isoform [Tetrahymena thermophila]